MTITLKPEQEQIVRDLMDAAGYANPEDAIETAFEMLRDQREWLAANLPAIDAKIQQGMAELDRGDGIPEDQLDAHLARLKALTE